MSALSHFADSGRTSPKVREVPRSDICSAANCGLFDHLVGDGEQPRREAEAECPGGVEVDHELELGRLHDREVGGLLALENPAGVHTGLAIFHGYDCSVAYQPANFGKLVQEIDRRLP